MLASLAGPRVARSLVPVQAAAANTTHARPTTACGGMAHALPMARVVSLPTLGTSAPLLISPSPPSAGDLAPAAPGSAPPSAAVLWPSSSATFNLPEPTHLDNRGCRRVNHDDPEDATVLRCRSGGRSRPRD